MQIIGLPVGMIEGNCYLVSCAKTKEAMVIDPGAEGTRILEIIAKNNINVKYIVNTHGHHDHIGAVKEVKEGTGALILIHSEDAHMLENPTKNLSTFMGRDSKQPKADKLLKDGDSIQIGELNFQVIHTPGHTLGGISLYNKEKKACFTGDTLFLGSIGRTDLPGGSYPTIIKSIKEKLLTLPDDVVVYPGHGPATTIAQEKRINPFLR
ncbi:MAG: MBL fold metallo-hydrolase [Clostridia bacterium]|nr:MBL fold metallo-hydrolase [Clostridia bacterium]